MLEVPLFRTLFDSRSRTVTFVAYSDWQNPISRTTFKDVKKLKEIRGPRIRRFVMKHSDGTKSVFMHDGKFAGLTVVASE